MKEKKDAAVLKWIREVSGSAVVWTGLLLIVRVLQGCISIVHAYALGYVIDCAQDGMGEPFYQGLGWFAALVVITLILQTFGRYLLEKSKASLDKAFRMRAFSQLIRRDYAQITRTHIGEWMNRLTSDTGVISAAVAAILPETVGITVRVAGAVAALLQIAPQIACVLLPCCLAMVIFSYFIRKWLKRYHKAMQQADGRARSFMQERLYSLLVVRTFTQEEATEKMASECMDDFVSVRMRRFRFVNLSSTILNAAVHGAQVLGIGLCGWGILKGVMSYGDMSSVLYLIHLLGAPMAMASGYLSQYYSMLASAERLMEIEEFKEDLSDTLVQEAAIRRYYEESFAALGLDSACFAYEDDEENVLADFSLEIGKGELIAFTGESGCGKSTALKVLLNLYPLRSGSIYLRDADGQKRTLDADWRGMFAYVPQGNQLISGTIRETITFGDGELMKQEEKLWKALDVACAAEFVRELPQGLDAVLGERGSGLSEGQMQRLSVARAILSGRPVLLLDEATSALDARTEEQLLQNLRAMTDRTVLIVTHREAALNFCDKRIHFEKNH